MILAVQWAKEFEVIDTQTKWYSERWKRGHVLENSRAKLVWDFCVSPQKNYHIHKTGSHPRRQGKKDDMALRCGMPPRG